MIEFEQTNWLDEKLKAISDIPEVQESQQEICGEWIWLEFFKKPDEGVRKRLKAEGFRWASKKKKWYFAGCKVEVHKPIPMDKIRSKYGSRQINVDVIDKDMAVFY